AVDDLAPEAPEGLELRVDPLTGLLDRQSLTDGVLPREVERALSTGQPLAPVVGRDDLVFRVEGDGFAALLPLDGGSAAEVAHRVVAAIARRSFATEN